MRRDVTKIATAKNGGERRAEEFITDQTEGGLLMIHYSA
jgi:hypothetical protein